MSGTILWIAVIALVIGAFGYIAVEGDVNPISVAEGDIEKLKKVIKNERCNQVGDCISVFLQPEPPVSEEIRYDEPEGQRDLTEEQRQAIIEGGGNITEFEQDYANKMNREIPVIEETFINARCIPNPSNPYDPCDDNSLTDKIQIGNTVTVAGNVKILDPLSPDLNNPNFVNPPFKYSVEIYCTHRQDCVTTNIARRGTTDTVGNFEQKWTTSQTNSGEGEYIAKITSWSIVLDPFDRPYLVENEYRFELFK